jgi:hypothetical protein
VSWSGRQAAHLSASDRGSATGDPTDLMASLERLGFAV